MDGDSDSEATESIQLSGDFVTDSKSLSMNKSRANLKLIRLDKSPYSRIQESP